MPQLAEIVAKRENKKFVKKNYRAWDLSGDGESLPKNSDNTEKENPSLSISIHSPENLNLSSKNEIETIHNKGSKQEFTNVQNKGSLGSEKGFTRVHKGSTNGSKESNKSQETVQLNPNIRVQLGFNNPSYRMKKLIHKLGGNERKLFFFLLNICALNGSLHTGEIFGEDVDAALGMLRNSRETSIKRLQKKGLLIRGVGKRGSNGTLCFSLPEAVKIEALNYLSGQQSQHETFLNYFTNSDQNRVQNKDDNRVQLGFNPLTSSSSSLKDLKTTTTEELAISENLDWLKEIDIDPLKSIGFSIYHLKQIVSHNKLSSDIIQQSIHAFAFDLNENNKAKTLKGEPLNFFMGILRKGMPYVPPPNYESPEDMAMRLFLERKKESEKRKREMEEEALKMAFDEWFNLMTEVESEALIPPDKRNFVGSAHRMAWFRTYFRENLWASRKAEFLGNSN